MKVLFFENMQHLAAYWQSICRRTKGLRGHRACTLTNAYRSLRQHKRNVDVIFIDGAIGDSAFNTLPLLRKIKKESVAVVVAVSGKYNQQLLDNGAHCTMNKAEIHGALEKGSDYLQQIITEKTKQQERQ